MSSGSLLDRNGLFANSAVVRDLFAAIPFGGPDVSVVDLSLVHHGKEILSLFVQKRDGGQVCIEFI
jgi:hypothetical protein